MAAATFPSVTRTYDDKFISNVHQMIQNTRADAVFEHNLILGCLFNSDTNKTTKGEKPLIRFRKPMVKRTTSTEYQVPLITGESSNTRRVGGTEVVPIGIDAVGPMQRFILGYYYDAAVIGTIEALENNGAGKRLDLFADRWTQMMSTIGEFIETDFWSTNTDTDRSSQKGLMGIQHLIEDDPTVGTTVAALSRGTQTAMRNQAINASSGSFASRGLNDWRNALVTAAGTNGVDKPDVCLTTPAIWKAYTKEAEDIHQITGGRTAELGFDVAYYQGKPVAHSTNCPAGTSYWPNMQHAFLVMPKAADFIVLHGERPANQLIKTIKQILFGANWGFTRYDRQMVVYGYSDT